MPETNQKCLTLRLSEAWGNGETPFSHAGTLGGVRGKYTYTDDCSTKIYTGQKRIVEGIHSLTTPQAPAQNSQMG